MFKKPIWPGVGCHPTTSQCRFTQIGVKTARPGVD